MINYLAYLQVSFLFFLLKLKRFLGEWADAILYLILTIMILGCYLGLSNAY